MENTAYEVEMERIQASTSPAIFSSKQTVEIERL